MNLQVPSLHYQFRSEGCSRKWIDREYHARRRGQKKLDECNRQILADGLTPRKTEFHTQKEFLRSAIEDTASLSCNQKDFQRLLLGKYNIRLKVSRGRFSYLHPKRKKYITGRALGTHYETDYLIELFAENAKGQESEKKQIVPNEYKVETNSPITRQAAPTLEDSLAILFVKSDLRLVVNLQDCVKAQLNTAYANKVKLSNLKEMARTVPCK